MKHTTFTRKLQSFGVLILLLVTAAWILNSYMLVVTKDRIYSDPHELPVYRMIVVPGASVYRSGKLSPALEQRMAGGLRLLGLADSTVILLSGHSIPQGYNEVKAMVDYARRKGVHPKRIQRDEQGVSTYATLLHYKQRNFPSPMVIVSQTYHLPRALYICRMLDIEAYGYAVEASFWGTQGRIRLRELLSRQKDFVLLHLFRLFRGKQEP